MTLTLPAAPATGLDLDFPAACRAILSGRPGALFYQGAAPVQAAVEPWLCATLFADRLCWRRYDRNREQGELFAAPLAGDAALQLIQTLWDELEADTGDAQAGPRPALPVYFSYELGAWLEPAVLRTPAAAQATRHPPLADLPLGGFLLPRALLAADGGLEAASLPRGRRLLRRFDQALAQVPRLPLTALPSATPAAAPTLAAGSLAEPEHRRYLTAVERVQQYIAAGDVYQVNVTRRATVTPADNQAAGAWFAAAIERHPAAQASFWSCVDAGPAADGRRHFLSFTPERLLRIDRQPGGSLELLSSPIKGTRPRPAQATPAELAALADELMQDGKEQAELNMIIDMTRNDLGRVADLGSVRVQTAGRIDPLPFVFHRVADVTATAAEPVPLLTLLRALFPGASITGAPKIRAMQIIRELEPAPRGIYCGVLGWLAPGHRLDWALAIRTLEARTATLDAAGPWQGQFGVGAGIVADSVPEREWQETIAKSRGILR